MALVPIPCTTPSIVISPALTWPPPFTLGFGYSGFTVILPVRFDFSPLVDLGKQASIQYFSFNISSAAHDWAQVQSWTLEIDPAGNPSKFWEGTEFLHSPPPDVNGYYRGSGTRTQLIDDDVKGAFDHNPSPAFGPYSQYFAQSNLGAINNPIIILGPCSLLTVRFELQISFQYWHFDAMNLAYNTHATPPVVTVSSLTAWCQPLDLWNCTDPCSPSVIASGHTGSVCLQAHWVETAHLPPQGFTGPPDMFAPLTLGAVNVLTACTAEVIVGCLTAEQIAANHYAGPWVVTVPTTVQCTFDGVGFTRIYTGNFSVSADVVCMGTTSGNPFNLQDASGKYHETGASGGAVFYRRSNFGTNAALGWAVTSAIGAPIGKTLHDPRVEVDHRQTVLLVYAQQTISSLAWDGVFLTRSNDDGQTWEAAVLAISGGHHPTIAVGQDGVFHTLVVPAYTGPNGGPGKISAKIQHAGDAALGTQFNFKDDAGADLSVADDTFHVQQAPDDQSRWMLHVVISGESSSSQWTSYDECATWKRVV